MDPVGRILRRMVCILRSCRISPPMADRRASQAFGFQKPVAEPLIPKMWRSSTFSLCQTDSPSYWWSAYPESRHSQRSMKVEIREAQCKLAEIAEQVLDYLYPLANGPSGPPTADPGRAVELYDTLVNWKLALPARLRLEDAILPDSILLQYVTFPFDHL